MRSCLRIKLLKNPNLKTTGPYNDGIVFNQPENKLVGQIENYNNNQKSTLLLFSPEGDNGGHCKNIKTTFDAARKYSEKR